MLTSPRELFHLSLSAEIFRQFQLLSSELHGMQMYEHKDKWSYNWGSLSYSSQKAYKLILVTPRYLRPLLVSRVLNVNLNKTMLHDKLNTRDVLRRRRMELESYTCENYTLQRTETWSHLFLRCNFALRCWHIVGVVPPRTSNPHLAGNRIACELRKTWSMEIIMTMT
jgi:hypothetical protein